MTEKKSKDERKAAAETEAFEEIEMLDEEGMEAVSRNKLKEMREKLKALQTEKMELMENLQRVKADFLNAKKRLQGDALLDKSRAVEEVINKILPICDSFELAVMDEATWQKVDATWRAGMNGIHNQLKALLSIYRISSIVPLGETFDPSFHEAIANVPVDDEVNNHKIISVILPGYERKTDSGTTLIRPARVTVGVYESKVN